MAHITYQGARPSFGFAAIRSFFANIGAAWEMQARVRTTMNELDRLNDAELHDLGISRVDIPRIAFEGAEKAMNDAR